MIDFALRLKGLIEDQDAGDVSRAARRLGTEEVRLVEILYGPPRTPPMGLFRSIVREYCVDPGWLLTGTYDPAALALAPALYAQVVEYLFRYTEGADTPPEEHPPLEVDESTLLGDELGHGLGKAGETDSPSA